ncbi:MAG TPA: ABC-type transport auxiliary lipoprotein family protein [Steroidobacteraceae bacterium]|nr:ABC-type transport auxiliary lipoprotein family protein [Steroidobacteraceae bacterium]
MNPRASFIVPVSLALASCGSVFESDLAAPQSYVLRLPAAPTPEVNGDAGRVVVQRPDASPGLESERIALVRSEQRFDFYAASRWAAPAPDVIGSVMIDTLRATGAFSAVLDDSAPFAARYSLRCTLRRFEADYTKGSGAPTVFVTLDCTLGRRRDRELLASFTAEGSARAAEDRLNAVVAAFESATAAAMTELGRAATTAVANEKPASDRPPSEGR